MDVRFFLAIALIFTGKAIADYSIYWFNVGGRAYEDGTYRNLMSLELVDENGNYIATDILQSVILKGPSGETIPLDDLTFSVTPAMGFGSYYDGWSGLWYFEGYFSNPYGGYSATLPDNLSVGTYTITYTDVTGNSMTGTKDYTGRINLPIVKASSIKTRYDNGGNLLIQWRGIYSGYPYVVDPEMQTRTMVCIGSDQSWWQMAVPAHMSSAFIPSHMINEIKSVGYGHYLLIQYRQNPTNCNRSYSNTVTLP